MNRLRSIALLFAVLVLAGCDMLGLEAASTVAARREAEGKAVGAGCRHSGRAIEDCYALNRRAEKAAVMAGWREMNDYMRENNITEVAPQLGTKSEVAAKDSAKEPAREPAETVIEESQKSVKPDSERTAKTAS